MSTPPLIHLDTNHLINIARMRNSKSLDSAEQHREAYKTISDWILGGTCSLTFYPVLLIEWLDGCANDQNAEEIAAVLDSAQNLVRVEMSFFTFKLEILAAVRQRFPQLPVRSVPILQPMGTCENAVNALRHVDPIAQRMASSAGGRSFRFPPTAREQIVGAREYVDEEIQEFPTWQQFVTECRSVQPDVRAFMQVMALRAVEPILPNLWPGQSPEQIVQAADLERCRGFTLRTKVLRQYIWSSAKVKHNDILDVDQAHIPAYADFVLTERRMRHLYHTADSHLESVVFSSPTDFVHQIRSRITSDTGDS